MPNAELTLLAKLIEEGYAKKAWHGPNLRGSIRNVRAAEAAWRVGPERHNIWELVVHAAYWKYAVVRRLTGEKRGSFPLKGSNWFRRPAGDASETAWKVDQTLLEDQHRRLQQIVGRLSPAALHRRLPGSQYTPAALLAGIAAHDVYHAGQIQLLKRLMRQGHAVQ